MMLAHVRWLGWREGFCCVRAEVFDMSGYTLSDGPALYAIAQLLTFAVAALVVATLFKAVVTAVVGFSLQDVLGNVMGGLALNIDRSVRVGD